MRPLGLALLCAVALVPSAAGQRASADSVLRFMVRLDGGSFNPDDPFRVTLAYGAQFGWQLHARHGLFLRATWQELSLDIAGYPRDDRRRYVSVGYERYVGWEDAYHQQLALRVGAGAVFRRDLGTAPFVSGGVALRYPVGRHIAFLGTFEDALAALPKDTLQDCYYSNPCRVYEAGGKVQHNFGLFISVELRP